ncbi:uncharacterized protein LOC104905527 isoform X2 [Beta vulgaris subsp. vulgaris]|uniref:uncharacterized protein LOC104905527 isoform X2 n=1 Tax=Beta vulgaris subsp. vulgaris TaxID=3555 RepID=UPI002547327F|nr:uncharacterized protein LOC104905527 isoform X2 [Beta vulgaris subsp. vulgaris]
MQRLCKVATSLPPATPGDFLKWGLLGFVRTSKFASGFSPLEVKPLNSIMDVQRAQFKSPEDLASVWDDFHLGRGHIGASMKTNLYRLFEQRGVDCQYFVIPLWRESGYTTMFSQAIYTQWLPHWSMVDLVERSGLTTGEGILPVLSKICIYLPIIVAV